MNIKKAINRGQLFVNGPVFIIMMSFMLGILYAASTDLLPSYFAPLSFILGPASAWLFWSFAITKWRIWAFSRVNNHSELKIEAIAAGLIWRDGSIFEKTEIRTTREKNLIHEFEKRYDHRKRKFEDDISIKAFTVYKFSKLLIVVNVVLMSVAITVGVYLINDGDNYIIGIIMIGIGLYNILKNIKKITNILPPLIIGNEGIETNSVKHPWNIIYKEEIKVEGFGTDIVNMLYFSANNKRISVNLDDYNIASSDFRYKLKIYRGRYIHNITPLK